MRNTLQRLLGLSLAMSVAACTRGAPRVDPLNSLRPADQCQAARDSAAAGFIAVQPPRPTDIRMPRLLPADRRRGEAATLTLGIDSVGRVIPDRIQVSGTSDQALAARLEESARSYRFFPAVANGCAVPATYDLVFEL